MIVLHTILFLQNEKVADTKTRLQKLMLQTPQTQDKSLLVQTVALFEALLGKINQLQDDNDMLKKTLENNAEVEQLTKDRDQIVLELESTRYALEQSKEVKEISKQYFQVLKAFMRRKPEQASKASF